MGKKKKKRKIRKSKDGFEKSIAGSKSRNKERATISACIIVKNEETLLPQCLESIKEYVDEIIIVDTGSNDKTIEIAESS